MIVFAPELIPVPELICPLVKLCLELSTRRNHMTYYDTATCTVIDMNSFTSRVSENGTTGRSRVLCTCAESTFEG
jgi:hypothetical protein